MLLVPKQRQAIGRGIKEHVKKDENIKKKGLTKNCNCATMVSRSEYSGISGIGFLRPRFGRG
jgi:hypothetical protein